MRIETYDDFPLRNDIARNLEEVVGRMPRRALRMGLPVFRADLIEPFQVQRGDLVDVTAIAGAAQLRMPALAETPGKTRRHDLAKESAHAERSSARESKEKTKRW